MLRMLLVAGAVALAVDSAAQVTVTEGTNFSVDVSSDGRIAIDLLGGIWVLPVKGGNAEPVTSGLLPARRPRWSPDSSAILYEAQSAERNELRLFRFDGGVTSLGDAHHSDQHASWHPDGERIVFASQRHDTGLDLWELDLQTGLSWRISSTPGDETEPAWSEDGRNLVFIHEYDGRWFLMLRRFGEPDRVLIDSPTRISAPSWRPDGSLITFARHGDEGLSISMLILSEPLLERTLIDDDDLFLAPVAWQDRQRMVYAARGLIRTRLFNSWRPRTVPFRATIGSPVAHGTLTNTARELPVLDEPDGGLVLRAERMFDGIGGGYLRDRDVVIEGGRIVSVENRRERPGQIVVDMGNLTVLPGYMDSYATLPEDADESLGPLLLTFGLTTVVTDHPRAAELNERWSGEEMPGPRVLRAATIDAEPEPRPWLVTLSGDMNAGMQQRESVDDWQKRGVPVLAETWQVGMGSGATLLLGGATLPASPGGHRYQDLDLASGGSPVTIVSGLADALTPGIDALLNSRQAGLLQATSNPVRRFTATPRLAAESTTVVLGSKPSGLEPGVGLHAEFRALAAAGLTPEQALRAAGVNATAALGLGLQLGRIAPGSLADLVIVDGDPLTDIDATLNVVAVVRNGRFYSTVGLIERAR
jgi:hypothetical protein